MIAVWILVIICLLIGVVVLCIQFRNRIPVTNPVRKFIDAVIALPSKNIHSFLSKPLQQQLQHQEQNQKTQDQSQQKNDQNEADQNEKDQNEEDQNDVEEILLEKIYPELFLDKTDKLSQKHQTIEQNIKQNSDQSTPLPLAPTSSTNSTPTSMPSYKHHVFSGPDFRNVPSSINTSQTVNTNQANHKMIQRFGVTGDSNSIVATDAPNTTTTSSTSTNTNNENKTKTKGIKPMYMDNIDSVGFKRRTRMLHVHVNQTDYNSTTGKLTVPINEKNVESFEIFTASIPKSEYVISSHNDTLEITQSGTTYTINTLVHGIYTASSLATELGTRITAAVSGTMTVSYSAVTETYTFTISSGEFTIDFTNYPVLGAMLGFSSSALSVDSSSSVVTAPNRVDLTRGRFLEISGTGMNKYYGNTDVVANIDLSQEVNRHRDLSCVRTFIQNSPMYDVILDMKVQEADGTYSIYNNRGLAFQITFLVRVVVDCINTDGLQMVG